MGSGGKTHQLTRTLFCTRLGLNIWCLKESQTYTLKLSVTGGGKELSETIVTSSSFRHFPIALLLIGHGQPSPKVPHSCFPSSPLGKEAPSCSRCCHFRHQHQHHHSPACQSGLAELFVLEVYVLLRVREPNSTNTELRGVVLSATLPACCCDSDIRQSGLCTKVTDRQYP